MDQVPTAIEHANPECRLQREDRVALSGLKLAVVKKLARMAGETEGTNILSTMRRVEISNYRVATPSSCGNLAWSDHLAGEMQSRGWRPMVFERGGPDSSWVYVLEGDDGSLEGLFVVEFDDAELEVVRVEGRIDRMIAEALAEQPGEAFRLVDVGSVTGRR